MSFGDGRLTLGPGEGKAIQVPGHPITYKATKEDTGGAYSLLEVVVAGEGPPQHIHKAEEEAFYVLEGEVNIKIGEQTIRGTVGTLYLDRWVITRLFHGVWQTDGTWSLRGRDEAWVVTPPPKEPEQLPGP